MINGVVMMQVWGGKWDLKSGTRFELSASPGDPPGAAAAASFPACVLKEWSLRRKFGVSVGVVKNQRRGCPLPMVAASFPAYVLKVWSL